MISKILGATDGSEVAWKEMEYAVELAKTNGFHPDLVYRGRGKPFFFAPSVPEVITPTHLRERIDDYLWQVADAILARTKRLCQKSSVSSQRVIRAGHPVEEIVKEAEASKADLVILGSHGKSSLKAALIGSVTFGVVHRETKVPLLVVRK